MEPETFIKESELLHIALSAWNIGCGLLDYIYDTETAPHEVMRITPSGDKSDDKKVSVMFYQTEDTRQKAAAIIDFEYDTYHECWRFAKQDAIKRIVEDLKRFHKLKDYTLEKQGKAPDPFYVSLCLGAANRIFHYMWLNTPEDVEAADPIMED